MPIVLVAIVLGLVGCTRGAELRDQFQSSDYRLPFDQRLRFEAAAPIIVLGTVLEVNDIGRPRRSNGDSRIKTQLTSVKISVDEMIRGSLTSNPVDFYYFRFSQESDIDLGVPRYLPGVGQHRIYFLKPSDKGYRSVGDVTDYTLPVSTGRHINGSCEGKDPGCCIAELLLVPQSDLDSSTFARSLIKSEYVAEVLCSRPAAFDLVRKLIAYPDKQVSDSARQVVAAMLETSRPPSDLIR